MSLFGRDPITKYNSKKRVYSVVVEQLEPSLHISSLFSHITAACSVFF
jgi:hypothetical protein